MEKEERIKKIIRLLAKECSPAEKEEIEEWIEANDENRNEFISQKEIWEKANIPEIKWDTDSSWNQFAIEQGITSEQKMISHKPANRPSYFRAGFLIRAAAILLIIITGGYFGLRQFWSFNTPVKTEIVWNQTVTAPGEKIMLTLGDNTTIILNAESKLNYPAGFSGKIREVYLEGEAYFEVQHDTSRPFIIHTQNISTKVLGTKFNISAFPGDNKISVSLVEGRVNVAMNNSASDENEIELLPKQQLVYDTQKKTGKVEEFDYQQAVGWKDSNFIFNGETLMQVFAKLEKAYGIKFELTDKSMRSKKIKVNFRNATLWTINESLKKLTGLSYKTVEENKEIKKVIFYSKQIKN